MRLKKITQLTEVQAEMFDSHDRFSVFFVFFHDGVAVQFCAISTPDSIQLCLRSPKQKFCAELKT